MKGRPVSALCLLAAGFFGATGVAAGAYGWHSLGEDQPVREIFMIGVSYQMWHALALVGLAWLAARPEAAESRLPALAGLSFSLGVVLFSGTLYAFAIDGSVPLEGAAPAGGWLMIGGWTVFMWSGWKTLRGMDRLNGSGP